MDMRHNTVSPLIFRAVMAIGVMVTIASANASAQSSRLTVFISDLHLGVGKDLATGKWHRIEDFRWEEEFSLFLEEIDRQGEGSTDLVLNGDTFELWQSLKSGCVYKNENLGCTEEEALDQIKQVLNAHVSEIRVLGKFASALGNRLFIVPGNHDAALLFPAVANTVLRALVTNTTQHGLPDPSTRIFICSEEYWLSDDRSMYAEHEHQKGNELSKFDEWPAPFIDVQREGKTYRHLQRPWGEQFVQSYYNKHEEALPIIDNMTSEIDGILYALAAEKVVDSIQRAGDFLKFFLLQESWAQFTQALGDGNRNPQDKPIKWNIEKIRWEQGDRFLVESLPTNHPLRQIAETTLKRGTLQLSLSQFDDGKIKMLCNKRAPLQMAQIKNGETSIVSNCPTKDPKLGAISEKVASLVRLPDAVLKDHVDLTLQKLIDSGQIRIPFSVFVYSHTHQSRSRFPLSFTLSAVNTGAWQRVAYPEQLETIKAKNSKVTGN